MENALILKFDGNRQLIIEINTFSNYQKEFESIYKDIIIEKDSTIEQKENLLNELKENNENI